MTTMLAGKNGLIIGIALLVVNMAVLAPLSTGAVEDAVQENVATKPLDDACKDGDCANVEADWASSTESRDFYAYSITNLAAMMSDDVAPTYEMLGPFTYDVTSTKTVVEHNSSAGTLTYNEVISYECAADSEYPCDTQITNLNIAFQPSVIGATGDVISGIMDITKAGFTRQMLAQDLTSLWPGVAAASAMSASYADTVAAVGGNETMASTIIGENFYAGWDQYFADNDLSGAGTSVTYSMATGSSASFDNLTYAFTEAVFPGSGEDVSLLSDVGTMVFAGHCDAYPSDTTDVTNSSMRAEIWNYTGADNATTIANDWAMCYGIGGNFATNFGGGDDIWMLDTTGESVNASTRLSYAGITMDNMAAMVMLFGAPGDENITGLLEVSEDGKEFGVANFLGLMNEGEIMEAMTVTGIQDATTLGLVTNWALGWFNDSTTLPMILLQKSGEMNASLFVSTSFGAANPLDGTYLANSLNIGQDGMSTWELLGRDAINLDPAVSENMLYGDLGLATQSGAVMFLYGELAGETPPIFNGLSLPWNETTIGTLYSVDEATASAMRLLMMGDEASGNLGIYTGFVPGYLMSIGATPYLTQSINNWLLGWQDAVTGDWLSLETNETYYGSGGVANGDGTQYTICTGEKDTCDKGEMLMQDGSPYVSWRDMEKAAGTFGILTPESLEGATGGFVTGDGDRVDLSGYGVVDLVCTDGSETVKDIPVTTCTATMDPTTRSVQAKLLDTDTLLDALPGALPVYFGSDVTVKAEDMSGAIISGTSESTFYLDTREMGNQSTAPTMDDLQPVFIIKTSGELSDSDADSLQSAIYTNQEYFGYWTNFDHPIDFLTLIFYVAGVAMLVMGIYGMSGATEDEDEMKLYTEEPATEAADESGAEESSDDA
jgi:hypothetical protein